ncbi:hypothetical protein GQ457_15G023660 [Hibiscus cannabinus]
MNHYECNNVHKDCRRTRGRGSTRKPTSMPVFGRFDIGTITHLFRRCDYNGDCCLSKEELEAAFRTLESRFTAIRASKALGHAEVRRS